MIWRRSPAGSPRCPACGSEVIEPKGVVRVPLLRVHWDGIALDGMGLRQRLLDGTRAS